MCGPFIYSLITGEVTTMARSLQGEVFVEIGSEKHNAFQEKIVQMCQCHLLTVIKYNFWAHNMQLVS